MRSQPLFSPRTRRTIWRVALCALVPLLALMALRLIWGWEASHRLAKVIAQLKSEGVQFERPVINTPEDQDPQVALLKAILSISLTNDEHQLIWAGDVYHGRSEQLLWTNDRKPLVRMIIDKNRPAFAWIDAASTRAGIPRASFPSKKLSWARVLGELLRAAALMANEDGRDAEAIQDLRRILTIARTIDQNPTPVDHLTASNIRGQLAAKGVEDLEGRLRLNESQASAQAELLASELNDVSRFQQGACRAWDTYLTATANGPVGALSDARWIAPLRDDELARLCLNLKKLRAATRATSWPGVSRALETASPPKSEPSNLSIVVFRMSGGYPSAYEELMLNQFWAIAQSRASAVLLYARLYEKAHGHLPSSLDQLVPESLREMPADPFSARNEPLHYRVDPDGPTLWSVGENGTDEGGIVQFDSDGVRNRWGYSPTFGQTDIVFGAGWMHAKPPTPKPK